MAITEIQTRKRTQNFKSCKECAEHFGEKNIPDWMLETELCILCICVVNKFSKEVIQAVDTLKKVKVTPELFELMDTEFAEALLLLKKRKVSGETYNSIKVSCKLTHKVGEIK